MAFNHRTVQRFLLTSKQFFCPEVAAKQAKRCVPHLRTSVPREFSSEWVDPIQYRIGMLDYVQRVQGASHE
jgi:hypothetical protein